MSAATEAIPLTSALPGRLLATWRWIVRADGRLKVGAVLIAFVLLLALLGPAFAPHSPTALVDLPSSGPSGKAALGTDLVGHDILSRILNGGRTVLWMSLVATAFGLVVGASLGLIAGYVRGRVDDVFVWVMDVMMAFPTLVFILLITSVLGRAKLLLVILVGIAWVPILARLARSVTLEIVNDEFVEAAEVIGTARRRILFREILPNILTPLFTQAGVILAWSVGLISGMSFLGLGVTPPAADWGLMVNENFSLLTVQPWSVVGPIICIAIFALGANLFAEGLTRTLSGIKARSAA